MANIKFTDADGVSKYRAASGAGSDADPFYTRVIGNGCSFSKVLTTTNGAYTIGDVVGGLITITGAARVVGGRGILRSIKLSAVTNLVYELHLFNADLATPAVADNGAMTLVVADSPKWLGWVPIAAADYCTITPAAFSCATVRNINLEYKCGAATTSLYAYIKTTVTTTPGTTNMDFTFCADWVD